jgi:hypothetical protein
MQLEMEGEGRGSGEEGSVRHVRDERKNGEGKVRASSVVLVRREKCRERESVWKEWK